MGEKSPIRGMQITALHHTEMAGELACLPNEAFQVEVVDELIAEF
jgi:hypothetical protein